MTTAIDITLLVFAVGMLIPMVVFCAECLASVLFGRRRARPFEDSEPRTAVLIPAHDEASVIGATLARLTPTLRVGDRVVVVADNCSDDTAAIARGYGVEVVERRDATRRGKPYALQFGLEQLAADPPDTVVVLDADCCVDEMTVRRISDASHRANRPAQALNLCHAETGSGEVSVVSELGFRFKNLVRPIGAARIGLPCHLMGTGMAVPWSLLQSASFADDHLAEDMQLGVELALQGHPSVFCPDATVTSALPQGKSAFVAQRTRWEQGHLHTMLSQMPRLLWSGIRRLRPSVLFLALDLTVPPLSLLIVCWMAVLAVTVVAGLCGAGWLPALLLAGGGTAMVAVVLAGWARFCRERIPLSGTAVSTGLHSAEGADLSAVLLRSPPAQLAADRARRDNDEKRHRFGSDEMNKTPVRMFGIEIDAVRMPQAVERVMGWIHGPDAGRHHYVVTPNADHAVMLSHHDGLQDAYKGAELVLADGMPVVLASRVLRRPLPERVTGADLVPALFSAANEQKPVKAYLLGAGPGVAERAAANIHKRWRHVEVVGTYSPPFGFEKDDAENEAILKRIEDVQPDVLVVGLGAPKQELWVAKHRDRIAAKASLCVGATIDFLAGEVRRAPRWMQRFGLEWFFRLACEPRRLFKRYFHDACVFPKLVWREWRQRGHNPA